MREKLTAALLLLIAGVALSSLVNLFFEPQPQRNGTRLKTSSLFSKDIEAHLGLGREQISPAEAAMASAGKMMPLGTKSLLIVPARLQHGDYVWNEEGVPPGQVAIWVDLRRQMISVFRSGQEIGTAVIVYGAEGMASPEGTFPILRKSSNYHSRSYGASMPNSLFISNDGVALHGSPISKRRASHGCVGLPVEFAHLLFEASKVGDIVEITRSDATLAYQLGSLNTANIR